ncbi:hypothetical protein [Undibacterium sp. WLX3042]|uniref:hypothetical protein n=1 Tax=Undibacterium sp. WLX3042 TaxID=3412686 RepID=UPI003C2F5100
MGKRFNDEALVQLLENEFRQDADSSVVAYNAKLSKIKPWLYAANDPSYPQLFKPEPFIYRSSDNKRAKTYRFLLIIAIFCIWLFLGTFRLISALVLSFVVFIDRLNEGQNNHSPT